MSLPTFEEARRIVEQHAATLRSTQREHLPLLQAAGRVLSQPIVADRDQPPFPRAARDGFALRAADVATVPSDLTIVAEIKAGMDVTGISISARECAEIMTGAVVPQGADAVVGEVAAAGELRRPRQHHLP